MSGIGGQRRRAIEGFPEPSWSDVMRRRQEWEPWADDRLVVDSACGLDENIAKAVDYLAAGR